MRLLLRLLCIFALLCAAGGAQAQSCTVSATSLAFGVYSPSLGTPNDSAATITVTCSAVVQLLVAYNIQISAGGSGNPAARRMSNGSGGLMNYQIYSDLLHTKVWGDGSGGTQTVSDGFLLGVVAPVVNNYFAYGRIPAGQNVQVGSYSDATVVTISY